MNQGSFESYHEFLNLMESPENSFIEVSSFAGSGRSVSPQLTLNLDLNINSYYDGLVGHSYERQFRSNKDKYCHKSKQADCFPGNFLPLISSRSTSPAHIIRLSSDVLLTYNNAVQMEYIDNISLCSFTDEEYSHELHLNETDYENNDDYNDDDKNIPEVTNINPYAPILFPPINVQDRTQFMSLTDVPLRPSFIET